MRKVLRKLRPAPPAPPPPPDPPPAVAPVDWIAASPDFPSGKKMISLRVDADVLAFFQGEGKGYQTRMNAVLRSYMNARKDSP